MKFDIYHKTISHKMTYLIYQLGVKGYSDKLDVLLRKVLEKLVSFKPDPKRYEILKEMVCITNKHLNSHSQLHQVNNFVIFLAHLSRRLMGELIVYQSLRRPSVVLPSTISNIFS